MNVSITPRTVVEALLPMHGETVLAAIYDAGREVGLDVHPVRLTLRRMIAAGDITQVGRGRRGSITLTEQGRERLMLDRGALQLAFEQDRGEAAWDGLWRMYAIKTPESQRPLRDAFRRDMRRLGAAPVATSLYVSPHDLSPLLTPAFTPHLTCATATSLNVRGITAAHEIVELLWPGNVTEDAYALVLDLLDAVGSPVSQVARQLQLAQVLELALRDDPLIPGELRAQPWRPSAVRRRWLSSWRNAQLHDDRQNTYRGWLACSTAPASSKP